LLDLAVAQAQKVNVNIAA